MLFSNILLHSVCKVDAHFSAVGGIYKIGVHFWMCGTNRLSRVETQYHERGGEGIGCCTVVRDYCRRQYVVLYRVSRAWVYSVSVFLSVFIVKVAVVTRCRQAYI